jgi:hypothetical protein
MANMNPFGAFAEGLQGGLRTGTMLNHARMQEELNRLGIERAKRDEAYQKDLASSMAGLDTMRGSGVEGVTRGSAQDAMLAEQNAGLESPSQVRAEKGRRMLEKIDAAQAVAFRHGRLNDAADAFVKSQAIREQFAKEAVGVADREYAVTKDPSAYFRVYEWVGDGVTPIAGQWTINPETGERSYLFRYKTDGGQEGVETIPEKQVPDYIAQVRNPEARAKLAMERAAKLWDYENLGGKERTQFEGRKAAAAEERNRIEDKKADALLARAQRPVGSGGGSRAVEARKDREETLLRAGLAPDVAAAMSVSPSLGVNPKLIQSQARFIFEQSKDPITDKPTVSMDDALKQAQEQMENIRNSLLSSEGGANAQSAGVLPSNRGKTMEKAGIVPNVVAELSKDQKLAVTEEMINKQAEHIYKNNSRVSVPGVVYTKDKAKEEARRKLEEVRQQILARPKAHHPITGEVVEWDGNTWVSVK